MIIISLTPAYQISGKKIIIEEKSVVLIGATKYFLMTLLNCHPGFELGLAARVQGELPGLGLPDAEGDAAAEALRRPPVDPGPHRRAQDRQLPPEVHLVERAEEQGWLARSSESVSQGAMEDLPRKCC